MAKIKHKPHHALKKGVRLGKGSRTEPGALVGYRPQRKISDYSLKIGKNSHVRHGSVVYLGSEIGDNLETGHNAIIREENRIGNNFKIWNNSVIDYGCKIGNNVKVHSNVYVAQFTTIEDGVFLAPGVMIANDIHPGCELSNQCMKGPTIKKGARIGVNVTILPFVTIGEGALIGAGAVVTRDIPAHSVAYGNPCRVYGQTKGLRCITGLIEKPYKL